jgi:hypothetical protein
MQKADQSCNVQIMLLETLHKTAEQGNRVDPSHRHFIQKILLDWNVYGRKLLRIASHRSENAAVKLASKPASPVRAGSGCFADTLVSTHCGIVTQDICGT